MPPRNLHAEPFDEATIAKLKIFEDYVAAWLPTFVLQKKYPEVCIFDFFAGTGYDVAGVPGSPVRILEKIKSQIGYLYQNKVKVKLYLNEFEPDRVGQKKFEKLKEGVEDYLTSNGNVAGAVEVEFYNEDFATLFPKLLPIIKQHPSLVYLDQNGIQFLSDTYLLALEKLTQTDFLYFVSTSYAGRFGNSDEFKRHIDLDIEQMREQPARFIHRVLVEQLRKKLPSESGLKLYPFSIKKGTNVHGIIFGAKHPRAVDKFLDVAWKHNPMNGDANFDIDNDSDIRKLQTDLFGNRELKKVELFKQKLEELIKKGHLKNNKEVLHYVYEQGHIHQHADEVLRKLKKEKVVTYDCKSPLLTYQSVFNPSKKRLLNYQLLTK